MLGLKPMFSAFLLSFCLLFATVSPVCRKSTNAECQKHKSFVPGHSLAGEGFDVTSLERKGAKVLDMHLWQNPDGTCTLCQNPLLAEKPLQRLPLAAADWESGTDCKRDIHSSLQTSGIDVVQNAGSDVNNDWKVELDVPVKPQINTQFALAGSHSKVADFSMSKSGQDKYSFASHEISCTYYRFHTSHHQLLSDHFKHAVKNLPKTYENGSRPEYRQLIGAYGTHYIKQLHLGGRMRDVTAVHVCEMALDGIVADEVKDCLSLEAAANIGSGRANFNAVYKKCEDLKKKQSFKGSFHETYKERHTQIVGGNIHTDLLFSNEQSPEAFKQWLESVKTMPDLISYSLEPIHTLVSKKDPKRKGLRQAVSEYIRERALWRNCTHPCPAGTQRSVRDPCSCVCQNDGTTNSMCCPQSRGLAKLTVEINRGYNMRGDIFTMTDAYVKVFYQGREIRTSTVWNNNDPTWKVHLDFGNIRILGETSRLRVQVWDENKLFRDNLLGGCDVTLKSGKDHSEVCYLNHGRLEYQYDLVCESYLGGPYCLDYTPQQPRYEGDLLQRKQKTDLPRQKTR